MEAAFAGSQIHPVTAVSPSSREKTKPKAAPFPLKPLNILIIKRNEPALTAGLRTFPSHTFKIIKPRNLLYLDALTPALIF